MITWTFDSIIVITIIKCCWLIKNWILKTGCAGGAHRSKLETREQVILPVYFITLSALFSRFDFWWKRAISRHFVSVIKYLKPELQRAVHLLPNLKFMVSTFLILTQFKKHSSQNLPPTPNQVCKLEGFCNSVQSINSFSFLEYVWLKIISPFTLQPRINIINICHQLPGICDLNRI